MFDIKGWRCVKRKLIIELEEDTDVQLTMLAESLGFSREDAALYAVRLVNACVREGLIADIPARAWPEEARLLTGNSGKVLSFARMRREKIPAEK